MGGRYMRFAQRSKGVDAARAVFSKARKAGQDTHHVYIAMARLEFFVNKEPKIATKIFEAGLKKHGSVPAFVQAFVTLLVSLTIISIALLVLFLSCLPTARTWLLICQWSQHHTNDEGNLRVLLERIVGGGAFPFCVCARLLFGH